MRRTLRWLGWIVAAAIGLPALLLVLLFAALNTAPGQREAAALINRLAGADVTLAGLHGRFPDRLRVERIALRDREGSYATLTDVALDWSAWRLLSGVAAINRLSAAEMSLARLPVASAGAATPSQSSSPSLPVRVDLAALRIDRLDLGAPVIGVAATVAVAGSAHLTSLEAGRAELTLTRLDSPGSYHLAGRLDAATIAADLAAQEPAQGFLARLAGLPGLGALTLRASLDGPWRGAATRVALSAGPLRLDAHGRLDLTGETADLDLTASAPAMAPRPDLSWASVAIDAHVAGRFAAPQGSGTVRIEGLRAAGAGIAHLAADLAGDAGHARVSATAEGLTVPGPKPDLLAGAPLALRAEADLAVADRPVRFTLDHKLLTLSGTATLAAAIQATAHLDLPDLAPFGAAFGQAVAGHAALDLTARTEGDTDSATIAGTIALTAGPAPLPALLGPAARIDLAASRRGPDVSLSRLAIDASKVSLTATGGLAGGKVLTLDWRAALPDLAVAAPTVQGSVAGQGHVTGPLDDFAAQAELSGEIATAGVPRGPLTLSLAARGLPDRPSGQVRAHGTLDGAPLALDATASRDADGALHVAIDRADWRSAHADGGFTLAANAALPVGKLSLAVKQLDDLSRLLGRRLRGSVAGSADLDAQGAARLKLEARDAGLPGTAAVATARLDATVRDPTGTPDVNATLDVGGLRAGALAADAKLTARGPQSALALRLQTSVQGLAGAALQADGAAMLDMPGQRVTLSALRADWRGETLRLLAPARVAFAPAVTVDRLRLGVRDAVLEVAGRLAPTLDLTASLRGLSADLADAFVAGLKAQGTLQADARLTGSPARPAGRLHIAARGLRVATAGTAGLPAADLTADATLTGTAADIDARLEAGRNRLALTGSAPIPGAGGAQAMRLRGTGAFDLATLNPLLTARGERVLGRLALDAVLTGTPAVPRATGSLTLTGGEVQDFALGAHLTRITGRIDADGDTIRIASLTGRAGKGTFAAGGSVGLGGAMPVALTLTARNAAPLASDRLTATMDADLTLRGEIEGQLAAGGTVKIDSAEIRIPDRLPGSIAVLDVRRPGQKPPPPPAPPPDIALDLTVTAPGQAFIRGRGLFAEVAGRIKVGGTVAKPVPVGVFRLRRGSFNLAGTSLTFTSGDVRFEGSGKLDPALHLVATSTNGNIIATLTVGGFASAPKITLSSTPPLPQDEVLAQLLFHQSAGSLSPVQLASAAAALAQVGGVGGGVLSPLDSLRQSLGLDRLTVGGGQAGAGATVEAGRYVAKGIYVGAKQAAQGTGTQASVQIDLMKGLKLETSVGTGGQTSVTGAAATQDPYGTSVGLTYQFQY